MVILFPGFRYAAPRALFRHARWALNCNQRSSTRRHSSIRHWIVIRISSFVIGPSAVIGSGRRPGCEIRG